MGSSLDGVDEAEDARKLCQQTLDTGALQLITQITDGIPDFVIDRFDQDPPNVNGMADGVEALRTACTSAARLITKFSDTQEARLEPSKTGRLIRVVLHADDGAAFCYSVVPGQHVVGFTFVPPGRRLEPGVLPLDRHPMVNRADHMMTNLVNALRDLVGLPSQDVGGWSSELAWNKVTGEDLVSGAVDEADLHFLARLRAGQPPVTVDSFDADSMRRYFNVRSRPVTRKFYEEFAGEMCVAVKQVNRLMRTTVGGTMRRVLLDVEQGAVAYYRIGAGDYLTGVTLSQEKVSSMDGKLAWLANELMARGG